MCYNKHLLITYGTLSVQISNISKLVQILWPQCEWQKQMNTLIESPPSWSNALQKSLHVQTHTGPIAMHLLYVYRTFWAQGIGAKSEMKTFSSHFWASIHVGFARRSRSILDYRDTSGCIDQNKQTNKNQWNPHNHGPQCTLKNFWANTCIRRLVIISLKPI